MSPGGVVVLVEAVPAVVDPWSHVVQFYGHDEELTAEVTEYLRHAIINRGVAIVVATPGHCQAFEERLACSGIDIADARSRGAFISIDAGAVVHRLLAGGQVDPVTFELDVANAVRRAAATGRPVRVFGELVALLWNAGEIHAALELETLWNDLGHKLPFALYCAYSAQAGDECHGAPLAQVCDLHTAVVQVPAAAASPRDGAEATHAFSGSLDATRAARHFVVAAMTEWGVEGLVEDAALVVSELATNSVVHAHSGFTVNVAAAGGAVRISVSDAKPLAGADANPPLPASPQHGLGVVAALATTWGVRPRAGGKAVWAELHPHRTTPAGPAYET